MSCISTLSATCSCGLSWDRLAAFHSTYILYMTLVLWFRLNIWRGVQIAKNLVNCLVICTIKCVRNFFTTCWIKKKVLVRSSMFNAQLCDTVLHIYRQIYIWTFPLLRRSVFVPFYLVCGTIGTAATPGLLCQPRVIVKTIVEKQMECRLPGETEVLGENLPQRHFCPSQIPTWPDSGLNPGSRGGKPATNRLSYGAAGGVF
jgi:hypothetical protein